jgi:hypothetical protein
MDPVHDINPDILNTILHSYLTIYNYNHPARRSNVRVRDVSGFISPFNGAKCFLMRVPMRNITG